MGRALASGTYTDVYGDAMNSFSHRVIPCPRAVGDLIAEIYREVDVVLRGSLDIPERTLLFELRLPICSARAGGGGGGAVSNEGGYKIIIPFQV